ncbi:uncharacterized protein LOC122319582 [Drosophila yakuba]|uniref:uncharacterized protein LOC122319582 n=1 Tax=Drosophila yakuba TaxID=7245 RepID=UPI001C8A30E8|nr:uncharacterized protein LOC122319582 [Drosophila yakuba]
MIRQCNGIGVMVSLVICCGHCGCSKNLGIRGSEFNALFQVSAAVQADWQDKRTTGEWPTTVAGNTSYTNSIRHRHRLADWPLVCTTDAIANSWGHWGVYAIFRTLETDEACSVAYECRVNLLRLRMR